MEPTPERVAKLYAQRSLNDTMLAKALGVSEVSQMARIELVTRDLIDRAWEARAARAAQAATSSIRTGSGNVSDADISRAVAAVDTEMNQWKGDIGSRFVRDVQRIYRLGREAGARKVTQRTRGDLEFTTPHFGPFVSDPDDLERQRPLQKANPEDFAAIMSFELVDENALDSLERQQLFWIGRHYQENVSESIATNVREEIIRQGRSRSAAGATMEKTVREGLAFVTIPTGWRGTSAQYFEGLTANASTVARVTGQLRSFDKGEVERYEVVNPSDIRTCPICVHMNGKVFLVKDGVSLAENALNARNPDGVRAAQPWIGLTRMLGLSKQPGAAGVADAKKLQGSRFSLPPFHFRCRCSVDISEADERLL